MRETATEEPTVLTVGATTFELPGGVVVDDGRRLAETELRPLSGREEEWLVETRHLPNAHAVTAVLGACIVRVGDIPGSRELARRMLIGDRDYAMLQLRRLTFGESIVAVFVCPACDAKMDTTFETPDIPVERRPQAATCYSVHLDAGGCERTLRIRLPTGADQEAVAGQDSEAAVDELLRRCVLDHDPRDLSEMDRASLIDAMEGLAPQVELELELVCPECHAAFLAPFDCAGFFLDEVRTGSRTLVREIHELAFNYHWSKAEILTLTRAQRRAYLALISDARRQD